MSNHQTHLQELKADLDEEYGIEATWISKDKTESPVKGIFSLQNKTTAVNRKAKTNGRIEVSHAIAYFSMAPESVNGEEDDQLIVNGEIYFVLPFDVGTFETIIPLKKTTNKNHNWSGYGDKS